MHTAADQEVDIFSLNLKRRRGKGSRSPVALVEAVDQAFAFEAADIHLAG